MEKGVLKLCIYLEINLNADIVASQLVPSVEQQVKERKEDIIKLDF